MKSLYIFDSLAFLFRSYYAIRGMTNSKGLSTNALYGFIRSIEKAFSDFSPSHCIAVFDGPNNKRRRLDIYKEYKSHRKPMPEDLVYQLEWVHTYCKHSNIPCLTGDGVEADDVIGAIAQWAASQGASVFICSSDKDLCQLISQNISIIHTHKNNRIIDQQAVVDLYGITPSQIVDYLAIVGDSADNIPGIPGFGPKTAVKLLNTYSTLENILDNLDSMTNQKQACKIRSYQSDVIMSKQLAQLITDIPFPKDPSFYQRLPPNINALQSFYQEMNFKTLLQALSSSPAQEQSPTKNDISYHLVTTEKHLKKCATCLQSSETICIDTIASTAHPLDQEILGLGFITASHDSWYIQPSTSLPIQTILKTLKPTLEHPEIAFYGHDIKKILHQLENYNIHLTNIAFDIMIAAYLCDPQHPQQTLPYITNHYLPSSSIDSSALQNPLLSLSETSSLDQASKQSVYRMNIMTQLLPLLQQAVDTLNLSPLLYEVEIPLIHALKTIERNGVFIDTHTIEKLLHTLHDQLDRLTTTIYELSHEPFNINSPKQLGRILYDVLNIPEKGKKRSTRAEILEGLKHTHPIIEKILTFRSLEKLRSTYLKPLPTHIHHYSHRIHPTFIQTGTATGRLSCQNPNLQNIPIRSENGKAIRTAFKPQSPEDSLLCADYSQIELRLLAHLSQDPLLLDAFNNNEDIHTSTASLVFDVPPDQVTSLMRYQAKTVNFGIIYGQQAFGLSQQLGITIKQAALFIEKYFKKYSKVQAFFETCKQQTRETGYATTMFGRSRPILDINHTHTPLRLAAERLAVNTPLQGSQADIIKKAMVTLTNTLPDHNYPIILQIHDELIFEIPDSKIKTSQQHIQSVMESAASLSVPLTVNISVGKNWGEC